MYNNTIYLTESQLSYAFYFYQLLNFNKCRYCVGSIMFVKRFIQLLYIAKRSYHLENNFLERDKYELFYLSVNICCLL